MTENGGAAEVFLTADEVYAINKAPGQHEYVTGVRRQSNGIY